MKSIIKQRFDEIDILRGIAIFLMVLIHTSAYFLSHPVSLFLWNASHFAVPVFVFCSAYIVFKKKTPARNIKEFVSYVVKRIKRLVLPYYAFMAVYLLFVYIKESHKLDPHFILQSVFVFGGIDINWLILLFLYLSLIVPFVQFSGQYHKKLFYFYGAFSFLSSVVFLFYKFPYNYRFIMWLPWSVIVYVSFLLSRSPKINKIFFLFVVMLTSFFASRFIVESQRHSLYLYDNKYPPNLYMLSYGSFVIILLYFVAKTGVFRRLQLFSFLKFLSVHSFSIYFIHILVIYFVTVFIRPRFSALGFFSTVLFITLAVQVFLSKGLLWYKHHPFSALNKGPTI